MSRTARHSLKLSLFTTLSRVLGLVRDHFQARFFGTGAIATAWEIAYMLPNMLRNLLAEGVLSQAFIPIYSEAMRDSKEQARRTAGRVLTFLFVVLVVLVLIGILIFPFVLPLYTAQSPEDAELVIVLSQVMFVFILTASLTAILAGISHTHEHYVAPALSPVLLNIIFILGFIALIPLHFVAEVNARYLAWVVVIGGVAQLSFQAWYVWSRGWWPIFEFRPTDPALKRIFALMAPAVLGQSIFQLNQLTDIALASYLIDPALGAVPALRYAQRLIQLPTGIIGVALSTAILPTLVAAMRRGEGAGNGEELMRAISFSLFLTVPASLGLFFLGPSILNLLFYGGAWGEHSTAVTWMALQFYCLGVPLYSINKVMTASYFAYQDTRTPVKILIAIVPINLGLNLLLIGSLQQGGLALSSAITALLNGGLLLWFFRGKLGSLPVGELQLLKQLPLWAGFALWLAFVRYGLSEESYAVGVFLAELVRSPAIPRFAGLAELLMAAIPGVLLYFTLAHRVALREWKIVLSALRRRRGA